MDLFDALGKHISDFLEDLSATPSEHLETAIARGLRGIAETVHADRISWYETDIRSGDRVPVYTAGQTTCNPITFSPRQTPFIVERLERHERIEWASLNDIPPEAKIDSEFLCKLGVRSLLLIPS